MKVGQGFVCFLMALQAICSIWRLPQAWELLGSLCFASVHSHSTLIQVHKLTVIFKNYAVCHEHSLYRTIKAGRLLGRIPSFYTFSSSLSQRQVAKLYGLPLSWWVLGALGDFLTAGAVDSSKALLDLWNEGSDWDQIAPECPLVYKAAMNSEATKGKKRERERSHQW